MTRVNDLRAFRDFADKLAQGDPAPTLDDALALWEAANEEAPSRDDADAAWEALDDMQAGDLIGEVVERLRRSAPSAPVVMKDEGRSTEA